MAWTDYYKPFTNQSDIKLRAHEAADARILSAVQFIDFKTLKDVSADIAIVGFAVDAGVIRNQGRAGAKAGPTAIRQKLYSLAKNHSVSIIDLGDIVCSEDLESAQQALGELVAQLQQNNIRTLVLGGGHETAYAHYQGLLHDAPSIVNFDAHFDLREPDELGRGSSGTPFLQIAQVLQKNKQPFDYLCLGIQSQANTKELYAVAQKLGVTYQHADELTLSPQLFEQSILRILQLKRPVYVTLCLDVFAQSFAPGVSAPQAMGLMPQQLYAPLKQLAASGLVKAFDVVELAPNLDNNEQTAKLAASLIHYWLQHWS